MEYTDQEAVQRTLANPDEFTLLVEKYQIPLTRYIRRLGIGDDDVAKDVLQEAFIKAYSHLNDYDSSFAFGAWMYRITHNETMAHFRKQKSRPKIMNSEVDLAIFEHIADDIDPAKDADSRLDKETLAKALLTLKPVYRDVITLRFFEDKSYAEIADILEIPEGTVATYIARGKGALRKALQDYHHAGRYY